MKLPQKIYLLQSDNSTILATIAGLGKIENETNSKNLLAMDMRNISLNEKIASGDQLSAQNSLKINIKFLDSLLDIDFYFLTIIFFL